MNPAHIYAGIVVQHAECGALGLVVRGGYRPRVRGFPSGRVVRTDEGLLRFAYADEWAMNRSLRDARDGARP